MSPMKESSGFCERVEEGALIWQVGISGRQSAVFGKLELSRGSE